MRVFARKPKATRQAVSVRSATPPRARPDLTDEVTRIIGLQRAIGNQNILRLSRALAQAGDPVAALTPASLFFGNWGQMPKFSRPPSDTHRGRRSITLGDLFNKIHAAAQPGLKGHPRPLPHLETIQHAFGRHALSDVKAFVGGPARDANERLGSTAYAADGSVAFSQPPDLRMAAHEAAHIVQQRAGAPVGEGMVRSAGPYEREADAVAGAVVHGYSAEPFLAKYARPHARPSRLVQCNNGACTDLRSALSNSMRVIELYEDFLADRIEWSEVRESIRTVGITGEGVVGAGQELPQIVKDAINEAEGFHLEDITHFGRLVVGLPSLIGGSGDFFNRQWVTNEIERQNRLNLIYIRYMYEHGCTDFPGQWRDYQQQILPIGTRGSEQRSTIEQPRETRTGIAWVTIGSEQILVMATEVSGAGRLRFERWIDSAMRDLALRQARAKQGVITSVPSSAMIGLPSEVPRSAARR